MSLKGAAPPPNPGSPADTLAARAAEAVLTAANAGPALLQVFEAHPILRSIRIAALHEAVTAAHSRPLHAPAQRDVGWMPAGSVAKGRVPSPRPDVLEVPLRATALYWALREVHAEGAALDQVIQGLAALDGPDFEAADALAAADSRSVRARALLRRNGPGDADTAIKAIEEARTAFLPEAYSVDRALCDARLGGAFTARTSGNLAENLENAIRAYTLALATLTQNVDFARWMRLTINLASAYARRRCGARADNTEIARALFEQVLAAASDDGEASVRMAARQGLIAALLQRERGELCENIEQAIGMAQALIDDLVLPQQSVLWIRTRTMLAQALLAREQQEPVEDLQRVLRICQETLAVCPPSGMAIERGVLLLLHGNALCKLAALGHRPSVGDARSDYSQALAAFQDAGSAERSAFASMRLADLLAGSSTPDRKRDARKALELYNAALAVLRAQSPDSEIADALVNLARMHVMAGGENQTEDLRRAIAAMESALSLLRVEDDPMTWAQASANLAILLGQRTDGDRGEHRERAIATAEAALRAWPAGVMPEARAEAELGLGILYLFRFKGEPADNAERAIEILQGACAGKPVREAAQRRPRLGTNLAIAYLCLGWSKTDMAIAALEGALAGTDAQLHPREWANIQYHLGVALGRRRNGSISDCEQANVCFQAALAIYSKLQLSDDEARVLMALGLNYERFPDEIFSSNAKALASFERALELTPTGSKDTRRLSLLTLIGRRRLGDGDFAGAEVQLAEALELWTDLLYLTAAREGVYELAHRIGDLGPQLAYCRFKLGDHHGGLEALKWARGAELRRVLTPQASIGSSSASSGDVVAAAEAVKRLQYEFSAPSTAALSSVRAPSLEILANLRTTRQTLDAALDAAGGKVGVAARPRAVELLTSIPEGVVLVAPIATPHGGTVLVVPAGTTQLTAVHLAMLPDLTSEAVDEALWIWSRAYDDLMQTRDWRALDKAIRVILDWLWGQVAEPVREVLAKLGVGPDAGMELVFMPSDGLGFLPLHAAWDANKRSLLDDFVVSYSPSVQALNFSRRHAEEVGRGRGPTMGVFNPQKGERVGELPMSETLEWPLIRCAFFNHPVPLIGTDATVEAVLTHAGEAGYLHFSCHGVFDRQAPGRSGLVLAKGERLDLRRIASLYLKNCRMVVTAACDTGVTAGGRLVLEQIGLPAAFLQAGAPAVVATLWPVLDRSTALLVGRLYELHIGAELRPAEALRQAVLELRAGTGIPVGGADGVTRHGLPTTPAGAEPREDDDRSLGEIVEGYSAPFFWAGFVTVGA